MRLRHLALSATLALTNGLLVFAVPGAQPAGAQPTPAAAASASAAVTVGAVPSVAAELGDALTAAVATQTVSRTPTVALAESRTLSAAELKAKKVVAAALSRVSNSQYVWGAAGTNSFDCSGLMLWSFKHIGISLPHSAIAQSQLGKAVSVKDLEPGDLLFFYSPVHHVGMYIGDGRFVHARSPRNGLQVNSLEAYGHFTSARRIIGA